MGASVCEAMVFASDPLLSPPGSFLFRTGCRFPLYNASFSVLSLFDLREYICKLLHHPFSSSFYRKRERLRFRHDV